MKRLAAALALAACGRVGFDPLASGDAGRDSSSAGGIHWVATLAAVEAVSNFTATAHAPGNAVVVHVECEPMIAGTPTVSVTAPGWTFVQLAPLVTFSQRHATVFGAFAPDTAPATVSVNWSAVCGNNSDDLADEFANVAAFDAANTASGLGDCSATVTTASANDAVWAACTFGGTMSGAGPGYTKSADDTHDDWAEYRITSDPAGTAETATFTSNGGADFVMSVVALRPQP